MTRINKDTPDNMVFVFGSNEGGIHGGGAARYAYKEKGARWGFSYGHMGQTFAIPTKGAEDGRVGKTLTLEHIRLYVAGFIGYARGHPELNFQVTCIGCGLAGLQHEDIAPMFDSAPTNCFFDEKWKEYLGDKTAFGNDRLYWGEG